MIRELLKGVVVPVVTPLKEDYSIDCEAMVRIGHNCLEHGVQSIFAFGTGGEGYGLPADEMASATEVLVEEFPEELLVGVLQPSTNLAIEFIKKASAKGAHSFVAVPPYYMDDIGQQQVFDHYVALSGYAERFVIYNIPGTTGIHILPETVLRIKNACGNCIGIKDSGGDLERFKELLALTRDENFHVMQGNCSYAVEGLRMGADGIVPVLGNVMPQLFSNLYDAVVKGADVDAVWEECIKLEKLEEFEPGWMAAVKASMNIFGLPAGIPLLPYRKANEKQIEEIRKYIHRTWCVC